MSPALFHGLGEEETTKQKEDQGMSVLFPNYFGFQDAEERKKGKREKGGYGYGYGLEDPPEGSPQGNS